MSWGWREKTVKRELQLGRPSSSCVKNSQHFDFAGTYPIGNNVRRSRNDEFARSRHAPGTANPGVCFKQIDRPADP